MNNRIKSSTNGKRPTFGLIAWLEQTRITLPLKGVECSFNVCGDVVSVEINQIFHQNNSRPLDCLYSFPLPAGAAVYRCEMHVNGHVIRAKVEEQNRARELAAEMKAQGRRTALVEMERDNLFTLSLGNVQPNDLIVIRFAYFATLTRLGDWTSFRIPFCPGIRYVPGTPLLRENRGHGVVDDTDQVADASRISPPRTDRLHRDAAYLSIEGAVEHPLNDVRDISSPTHPVLVRPQAGCSKVNLADQGAVPDSDFIVRWTEAETDEVRQTAWITRRGNEEFALLRLRGPKDAPVAENYAQDTYFLIDRSGSMNGMKWTKAVEAFRAFLNVLGQQDRVWATFFESSVRDLAEKPLPAPELLADRSVQNIEKIGVGGGTELLPALEHVLKKIAAFSDGRPASLLLITDGQVGNEAEILNRLAAHTSLCVHVFGIDATINDGFLNKLAAQHHGTSCLLAPTDDIVGAVARLGGRLSRPLITSIRTPEGWEIAGAALPDLHAGEVLSIPLRKTNYQRPVTDARHGEIVLEGKQTNGTTRQLRFESIESASAAISLLWARRRIEFLLAQGQSAAAIDLAKAWNLVCEGAAFIAWDEAEKVEISNREVYQPSMMLRAFCAKAAAGTGVLHELCDMDETRFSKAKERGSRSFIGDRLLRMIHPQQRSQEDDIEVRLSAWKGDMQKHVLLQTPAGIQFIDCLIRWARENPTELEERVRRLGELPVLLKRSARETQAERILALRKWVERWLENPFRDMALARLKEMESVLVRT